MPNELHAAVMAMAGGPEGFGEWARSVFRKATAPGTFAGATAGRDAGYQAGYEEGRRAGWAAANQAFRNALTAAAEKLKVVK